MIEQWLPVIGYEGVYEVSSTGVVRRSFKAQGTRAMALKPVDNGHYFKVTLSTGNRPKQQYIHRLVAAAFHGACPSNQQVNHIDGNTRNNSAANLEYVTSAENTRHAFKCGLIRRAGEHNGHAKLTWEQVAQIRQLRGLMSHRQLGRMFGVSGHTITNILNEKRWRDRQRLPDVREL